MAGLPRRGDFLILFIAQPQLQRRKVLLHPLRLLGSVEHYDTLVKLPADEHRALAYPVPARNLLERALKVQPLEPGYRGQAHIALTRDALGLQPPGVLGRSLRVRVELDLVDHGLDLSRLEQVLDVLLAEVGDADCLGLSCALGRLQLFPGFGDVSFNVLVPGEVGTVEEVSATRQLSSDRTKGLILCATHKST